MSYTPEQMDIILQITIHTDLTVFEAAVIYKLWQYGLREISPSKETGQKYEQANKALQYLEKTYR